ncbi:YceI family protein [Deminuibacter soli]|uniref:YceI family protein n=1 Tax=Deminuibacter soli TaxID=2291815 RepID=A0A3E1NFI3_9BACT|nr:YceI family protein [Deminuibacter soli]RFM26632.1 YceI family protein [Deminuibacter soli]
MKQFIGTLLLLLALNGVYAQALKPADEKEAIDFTIKNFAINTHGSLGGLKGSIVWAPASLSTASFNITVDVNTINTGVEARDNHLRKEEYFDVAKFPVISFTSVEITAADNAYKVSGNLTVKGVTKVISFPFTAKQEGAGYLFEGNFTINRRDFGIGGSSLVLSDDVKIALKVHANP